MYPGKDIVLSVELAADPYPSLSAAWRPTGSATVQGRTAGDLFLTLRMGTGRRAVLDPARGRAERQYDAHDDRRDKADLDRRPVGARAGRAGQDRRFSGEQLSLGQVAFVNFVALISLNLAFINLCQFPPSTADTAFYAAEAVRRKPVGPRGQEVAYRTGMALVLMLMIFVTINDLVSLPIFGS